MKLQIYFLLFILPPLSIDYCDGQIDSTLFDYGRVVDNKYTNSYFDFELAIPKNWVVVTNSELDDLQEESTEIFTESDSSFKKMVNATKVSSANLLTVFQYKIGTSTHYNPCISMLVENVAKSSSMKSGSDYLQTVKLLMTKSGIAYNLENSQIKKEIIDSIEFYKFAVEVKVKNIKPKQYYYTTIIKGFAVSIIISYINESQEKDLLNAIKSLRRRNF